MSPRSWLRLQFRKKTRVYILPTRMGGYLIGLIFLMFLLAIGYDNNLLLIFTLFLFSFNLLWLVQSHFHLHNLKLKTVVLANGHAGEGLPFKVFWKTSPSRPVQWDLVLEKADRGIQSEIYEQTEGFSAGEIKLSERGLWSWKFLKVSTILPFGLYRVWCFFPLNQQTYSYPALLKNFIPPDLKNQGSGESVALMKAGLEDIWNLAPYQGEESRRISWKHYAKSGELLVKEGEDHSDPVFIIRMNIPQTGKESYLSLLATQMNYCSQRGIPFLLESPEGKFGPASHTDHLHQCLKVLSLC